MQLKLDMSCHLLNVYTKFQIDISKHVEEKSGKRGRRADGRTDGQTDGRTLPRHNMSRFSNGRIKKMLSNWYITFQMLTIHLSVWVYIIQVLCCLFHKHETDALVNAQIVLHSSPQIILYISSVNLLTMQLTQLIIICFWVWNVVCFCSKINSPKFLHPWPICYWWSTLKTTMIDASYCRNILSLEAC